MVLHICKLCHFFSLQYTAPLYDSTAFNLLWCYSPYFESGLNWVGFYYVSALGSS